MWLDETPTAFSQYDNGYLAVRKVLPVGVDPTLVSPAAKSITREPIGRSCRDHTDHTGSGAPKSGASTRRSRAVSASLVNAAAPGLSESLTCLPLATARF